MYSTDYAIATLAPTGIAAINAGGRTIHSLFHFPFRPLLPTKEFSEKRFMSYDEDMRKEIRAIEILIIDEISMVRADILDCIDYTLRLVNGNMDTAFGGTQVIMVGDPFQLPPVVTNNQFDDNDVRTDKQVMDLNYSSPFFFDSKVFRGEKPTVIELLTVYRQKDDSFVSILNGIRDGEKRVDDLTTLNTRVGRSNRESIYLTSVRKFSDAINEDRMKKIESKAYSYKATKKGFFPKALIPQDSFKVDVKVGSRVMTTFNHNDGYYVNGSIGTVTALKEDKICITLDDDYVMKVTEIEVAYQKLQHMDNKGSIVGSYSFMPVKLAWAITIHKSQGLTFSNVNICPRKIFASGQLYVALSRCRTLEGNDSYGPCTY